MHTQPKNVRQTLTTVCLKLREKNKVQAMAVAERLFGEERYDECANKCYEVLGTDPLPSEAIQARRYAYLATEAVGPEEAAGRA